MEPLFDKSFNKSLLILSSGFFFAALVCSFVSPFVFQTRF